MGTLASSIINAAYRVSNLTPLGITPTFNQQTEGLDRLNNIVSSTVGMEAGDVLNDLTIGGSYDQTPYLQQYIPANTRLVLNLTAPLTVNLAPYPFAGQRAAIIDVAGNLSSYPVTINGNGRTVEGASSVVMNVNSDNREWIYRPDLGGWVKLSFPMALGDSLPFPLKFDDYFITMLASRLNPSYGQSLQPETVEELKRMRSQVRAYYHAWEEFRSDLDTRGYLADPRSYWSIESTDFKTGRPFPWR